MKSRGEKKKTSCWEDFRQGALSSGVRNAKATSLSFFLSWVANTQLNHLTNASFFFCCCYKTRKSFLRLQVWAGSETPGSISTRAAQLFLQSYQRYTTAQNHSTCQLRLTLHKLTGWLAFLDLQSWMTIKKTEISAQPDFLNPKYLCVHRDIGLIYLDAHQNFSPSFLMREFLNGHPWLYTSPVQVSSSATE